MNDTFAPLRLALAEDTWLALRQEKPTLAGRLQELVAAGATPREVFIYLENLNIDMALAKRLSLAAEYLQTKEAPHA